MPELPVMLVDPGEPEVVVKPLPVHISEMAHNMLDDLLSGVPEDAWIISL